MTTLELERVAAGIDVPQGATGVCMAVEVDPGGKLPTGQPSGIGGATRYRAAFVVDGRRVVATGPGFDRRRDASRLVAILEGAR